MMQKLANRVLRRFGWRLQKTPRPAPVSYPPTEEERARIHQIFRQFVGKYPEQSRSIDLRKWQNYLDDGRLSMYRDVVQQVQQRIPLGDKRILDFGSGNGCLLGMIQESESTAELAGIDSYENANLLGKLFCPTAEFRTDFEKFSAQKFDLIICMEVLEHLKDPAAMLGIFASHLTAGGALFLTVPNGRVDSQGSLEEREDRSGYWGHINFWSPESWQLFLVRELGDRGKIETGSLCDGGNFAFIQMRTGENGGA